MRVWRLISRVRLALFRKSIRLNPTVSAPSLFSFVAILRSPLVSWPPLSCEVSLATLWGVFRLPGSLYAREVFLSGV
jgi:hypothetical protein